MYALPLTIAYAVTERVLAHPYFQRARTVSIYLSAPAAEIDTWALCRAALRSGKLLYVPRFSTLGAGADAREAHSFTEMLMLRVYDVHELEQALTVNKWGIAEPALQRLDGTLRENVLDTPYGLDLILLPGLAFDRQGARLGQGKGYYDRYLAQCAHQAQALQRAPPSTMALALREQLLEAVPRDAHDQPVHHLVTSDAVYDVGLGTETACGLHGHATEHHTGEYST